MIMLRSGNGAPLWVVIGTAIAAASDTAPRNPAQPDTVRWRQSIELMAGQEGGLTFVEIGSSGVLTSMTRRIASGLIEAPIIQRKAFKAQAIRRTSESSETRDDGIVNGGSAAICDREHDGAIVGVLGLTGELIKGTNSR